MKLLLHAIEPAGPRSLAPPPDACSVHEVFDGLDLGVYSSFHTWPGARFYRLEDHLDRTDASMRLLGWREELDRDRLRHALHGLASEAPCELRFRYDVLSEPATGLGTYSRLLLACEPYQPLPTRAYERGVAVGVAREMGREEPLVNTARRVLERRPYPIGSEDQADHLLLDAEERVLEGTSSNIFFVRRGELVTAGEGVLEGIVRKVVLEIARELGIPVRLERVPLVLAGGCEEAFLTNSSRHVLPIVRIEHAPVGCGLPGPITARVRERFEELAELHARPAIQT